MTIENFEIIIIGGGQSGLAASYYLKMFKIAHIVLDQASKPGYAWREQRWDSFTFVIPNWTILMPGGTYKDFNIPPDEFISRDSLVKYFENYIEKHQLPVRFDNKVKSIEQMGDSWEISTNRTKYVAKKVIIATGFFQTPKIPSFSDNIDPSIYQMHSSEYKNPKNLKSGGVLIVGSGQSGMQIAEELYKLKKEVHLSIGSTGRIPRRYRGRDIIYWFIKLGRFDKPVESLENLNERFGSNPHLTGINGGHDLNIHTFVEDGVKIYGRLDGANGFKLFFKDNVNEKLEFMDKFENIFLDAVDEYIEKHKLDVPPPRRINKRNAYHEMFVAELNLEKYNITNIIWASGYNRDYSFIKPQDKSNVVDNSGYPIQKQGISPHKGLFFIGMPWIRNPGSGLLYGAGRDAEYLTNYILAN